MYHGCFRGVAACVAGGAVGNSNGNSSSSSNGNGHGNGNSNNSSHINSNAGATPAGQSIADVLNDNRGDIAAQFHAHFNQNQGSRPAYQASSQNPVQHSSPSYRAPPPPVQSRPTPPAAAAPPPPPSRVPDRPPQPPRREPTREPTLPPWTNAPFHPSPTRGPKTVIGYYASWQWYDRNKLADPSNTDFSKYDRVNYAFFQPDKFGRLYGTDEWADPQLLWGPYDYSGAADPARRFCSWDGPGPAARNCNYHDTSKGLLTLARRAGTEVRIIRTQFDASHLGTSNR